MAQLVSTYDEETIIHAANISKAEFDDAKKLTQGLQTTQADNLKTYKKELQSALYQETKTDSFFSQYNAY
jgi:hypothetical protein